MRVLRWLADYWYIPLLVVGGVLAWLWFRPRDPQATGAVERLQKELEAIRAARNTREMLIHKDEALVRAAVEQKYRAQIAALDEKKKAKVTALERDPVALAKYLERLTR